MELTERQRHLIVCCITAELEQQHQGDTSLTYDLEADLPGYDERSDAFYAAVDQARKELKDELQDICQLLR